MCCNLRDPVKRKGEPTMLIYYLFRRKERKIRGRENSLIKFAGEGQSLAKNDMHLTWKLLVLCFNCHGRVLSKILY